MGYTGPWQVPCKRLKKDPSAPKRPISAFLFFSQDKRSKIKDANPGMRNTDVSRVLGNMWKDASSEERLQHIEREAEERKKYKVAISRWKVENDLLIKQEEEEPENATDIHSRNIYHQEMVVKDDIRMQHSRLRYCIRVKDFIRLNLDTMINPLETTFRKHINSIHTIIIICITRHRSIKFHMIIHCRIIQSLLLFNFTKSNAKNIMILIEIVIGLHHDLFLLYSYSYALIDIYVITFVKEIC